MATDLRWGVALVAAGIAGVTSALVVALIRRRATEMGLVDVPNARSSHQLPTPRGGGLGILAGVVLAVASVGSISPGSMTGKAAVLLACSLVVGVVGLIDDRGGLSPKVRLCLQSGAAAVLVMSVGPVSSVPLPAPFGIGLGFAWVAVPLTVLWVTAVTNFFNFMDGVDGLAGGQAVASCGGAIMAGASAESVVVAGALGGASAGFLVHNWPPARIFMGDVGSGAIGFLLAGLPLLAPPEKRSTAVLSTALGLTFFILDPVLTLLRRALRREALMTAHRGHLYQRLIPAGTSGLGVTKLLLAGATLLSALGAWAYHNAEMSWIVIGASIVLFSVEFICASRARSGKCATNG